ncbi:hypothetical protein [Roseiconus lacunae]|uniref:hypothetical protein n=1 Tax=Roseiconus lacunae TaxID=2605694 RepID=UPI0011F1635E|nr:hypothetical protein [Roseiconus lacunae]
MKDVPLDAFGLSQEEADQFRSADHPKRYQLRLTIGPYHDGHGNRFHAIVLPECESFLRYIATGYVDGWLSHRRLTQTA